MDIKDRVNLSQDYIDEKILALPELLRFVQDDFISIDEKRYRREHKLTLMAIFVSVFFSLI